MNLLRLAVSMLLALGLAALSALSMPPATTHIPASNQSLALPAVAPQRAIDQRLASFDSRAPRRLTDGPAMAAAAAIVPSAGEFIPGAGQ